LPSKYQAKHLDAIVNGDLNCVHILGERIYVVDYLEDILLENEEIAELYQVLESQGIEGALADAILDIVDDNPDEEGITEYVIDRLNDRAYPQTMEEKML
jgi:hypothetical protein